MGIEALGYIGVRSRDLDDWASYGTSFLGLQRVDRSRSTLAFRMDDRKQRLVVAADGGQGIGFFGWEVADAAALDALAAAEAWPLFALCQNSSWPPLQALRASPLPAARGECATVLIDSL